MRWDTGSVYKTIRKSKNLSQKKICSDSISRTTLSKFENNKLCPSYDTYLFLLKQIDMSVEEFQFICNDYSYDERDNIIISLFSMISNLEEMKLSSLMKKCYAYLEINDDVYISEIIDLIQSLKILSGSEANYIPCLTKIVVSKIWNRLEKMDQWYYSELRLINCILFYFPIETVISFLPKLMDVINKYTNFKPLYSVKLSVLLNVALILIQNDFKDLAIPILEDAINYGKIGKRYDYFSIAIVRLGICKDDYSLVEKGLDILNLFNEIEISKQLKKEWDCFRTDNGPMSIS